MIENILSQQIVEKLGWTLIHFIWQGIAIAILAAIALKLLKKASSNVRYMTACIALAVIVIMPVITFQIVEIASSSRSGTSRNDNWRGNDKPVNVVQQVVVAPVIDKMPVQAAALPEIPLKERFVRAVKPMLPYAVLGWLVGVSGLSLWYLGGWTQLQRLRKRMVKPICGDVKIKLKQLSQKLGISRAVEIVESAIVNVPTVIGYFKPMILLPATALTGLSSEQIAAILAHELAHIKRCDYLVNILQTVVEILGFYHPAVWWLSNKIRYERENCCDDIAVRITGDNINYARALTKMEELKSEIRNTKYETISNYQNANVQNLNELYLKVSTKFAAEASGGNLFERICRLLGKDSASESKASWLPSVIAIAGIVLFLIPVGLAMSNGQKSSPGNTDYSSVTVKEGVGFDSIMVWDPNTTRESIIEKLGQPEEQSEQRLDYDNRYGLRFWLASYEMETGRWAYGLQEIKILPNFKGKLSSGITMSSSKQDVFKTYGQPIEIRESNDLGRSCAYQILFQKANESKIYYDNHGVMFWFKDDTIALISVSTDSILYEERLKQSSRSSAEHTIGLSVPNSQPAGQADLALLKQLSDAIEQAYNEKDWEKVETLAKDIRDAFGANREYYAKQFGREMATTLERLSDNLEYVVKNNDLDIASTYYEPLILQLQQVLRGEQKTGSIDISPKDFNIQIDSKNGICNLVVSIQNNGNETIPEFKIRYYRGDVKNNIDEAGNPHSGWHNAGPIEPGQTWNERTRDFHLPDGEYKFNVLLDFYLQIAETNENNNQATLNVTITNGEVTDKTVVFPDKTDKPVILAMTYLVFPIDFEITKQKFLPGDSVEITQMLGSTKEFEVGGTYLVKGRYKLSSHDKAMLHIYATNGEVDSMQGDLIEQGSGDFTRTFTYLKEGDPHLSFYPANGGEGFGGVYFAPKIPETITVSEPKGKDSNGLQVLTTARILCVPQDWARLKEVTAPNKFFTPEELEEFLKVLNVDSSVKMLAAPSVTTLDGEEAVITTTKNKSDGNDVIKLTVKNNVQQGRKIITTECRLQYTCGEKSGNISTKATLPSSSAMVVRGGEPCDGNEIILIVQTKVLESQMHKDTKGIVADVKTSESINNSAATIVASNENFSVLDVNFEPIRQGANILWLTVQNKSDKEQFFSVNVYSRSVDYGKDGVGWGTNYYDRFDAGQTRKIRYVYKIQGPITDDTYTRLSFYNVKSLIHDENKDIKPFAKKQYFINDLKVYPENNVQFMGASQGQFETVSKILVQFQGYIRGGEYEKAWELFSSDCQKADYQVKGLDRFKLQMEPKHPLDSAFLWEKHDMLKLKPASAYMDNSKIVLTAGIDDSQWKIDFVQQDSQWKIDGIIGYKPKILEMQGKDTQ